MSAAIETVIIGGGQAGLAMSYHLRQAAKEHVILERASVGESWRTERWDSLMFQFPNWSIKLPGYVFANDDPDGFVPKNTITAFIERYATLIQAPIRCGVNVHRLSYEPTLQRFLIETPNQRFEAMNVVVATGSYHTPMIPRFSASVPPGIYQIHTRDYRNPQQLPPGAVIIVGSGASGAQIAEELLQSGKRVYLSVGRHDKLPRRYRGKDLYWWLDALGIWQRPLALQPELRSWRPLFTGVGGGHDVNLLNLAASGMVLLGRLTEIVGSKLYIASDLGETLGKSEAWYNNFKPRIDSYALQQGMELTLDSDTTTEIRALSPVSDGIETLDFVEDKISSVIWAGGFQYDFDWIKLPVFDESNEPRAQRGVSTFPRLYFLGLRRTYAAGSSLLAGVGDDAAYLAECIADNSLKSGRM